jgi:hypothetical protein
MSLKGLSGSIISHMVIDMNDAALGTIAQLRAFLEGTLPVSFAPFADDDARYVY